MTASPSGPVQLHGGCGQFPGQSGEQLADFVSGQRDEQVIVRVAVAGPGGRGQDGQEGVGEQGQDGPPAPGGPAPDLVLVQGGELLAPREAVLNRPPLIPLKRKPSLGGVRIPV
jgi:hypothetical protein